MKNTKATVLCLAAALLALAPRAEAQEAPAAPERSLSLEEAIDLALEKNEDILIERQALDSAGSAILGAKGAYDPLLGAQAAWEESTLPSNSAFSGAPEGELAPTLETTSADLSVQQLLPTGGALSVGASRVRSATDGAFALLSPAYDTFLGAELRQPLLRGRAVDAARLRVRVAEADREGAEAGLRRVVIETVAATETTYWNLVAARLGVGVLEEAVRLAEEQLSETEIRIENGVAPETEIAQPLAELERRRGELIAAREQVLRAENALKLLILADGDGDLWLQRLAPVEEATVEVTAVDAAAAMERALAARPELATAAAFVARRQAETVFARNGILPSLDAVLSYDRFGLAGRRNPAGEDIPGLEVEIPPQLEGDLSQSFEVLTDEDFDDTRIALVLGISIGNRSARAAAAIARNSERQAEADLARLRKSVRAEVLDAAAALETAGQRIEAARAGHEAARVQWEAERDRYDVGLSTNFLVLTRQNELSRARLDEIEAMTDYRAADIEMGRATGSLLEQRGIVVEEATPEETLQ